MNIVVNFLNNSTDIIRILLESERIEDTSMSEYLFHCYKYFHIFVHNMIQPACATCPVGSYASLLLCRSVVWTLPNTLEIIHILENIKVRNLKFYHNILSLYTTFVGQYVKIISKKIVNAIYMSFFG